MYKEEEEFSGSETDRFARVTGATRPQEGDPQAKGGSRGCTLKGLGGREAERERERERMTL